MSVTALTPTPEPSLFALMHQAAITEQATREARARARQAEDVARHLAAAARCAHRDACRAFGEFAPDEEAWRAYPDRSVVTNLGAGHWLRWFTDGRARIGRLGTLTLLAPCPHGGHHEHEVHELTDLPDRVAAAEHCDGEPTAACHPDRHGIPDDDF
jgi:hypothetical protein